MARFLLVLFCLILGACSAGPTKPVVPIGPTDPVFVQEYIQATCVLTHGPGLCGCVFVAPHLALTAKHCVRDATQVNVQARDEVFPSGGTVVWESGRADLAAVEVPGDHPFVPIREELLTEDEHITAVHHPERALWTVTHGKVKNVLFWGKEGETIGWFFSAELPVLPGSSGGGVFDAMGHLVGIVSALSTEDPSKSYHAPAAAMQEVWP